MSTPSLAVPWSVELPPDTQERRAWVASLTEGTEVLCTDPKGEGTIRTIARSAWGSLLLGDHPLSRAGVVDVEVVGCGPFWILPLEVAFVEEAQMQDRSRRARERWCKLEEGMTTPAMKARAKLYQPRGPVLGALEQLLDLLEAP